MIVALLAAAAVTATPPVLSHNPVVVQPATHTIILTDQDLETLRFMTIDIGKKCTATDEGYQFCRAALLARDLAINMQAQLAAEKPKQ